MRGRLSQERAMQKDNWQPGQVRLKIVESHTSNYNVGDIVVGGD